MWAWCVTVIDLCRIQFHTVCCMEEYRSYCKQLSGIAISYSTLKFPEFALISGASIAFLRETLYVFNIVRTSILPIVMPQRSRGNAATVSKGKPSGTQEKRPDWPALQPLIPTTDLILETLLEDQIILIRNLFTSTLCKKYVSFLSSLPLITTPAKPKDGEALRVNDRIQYDDPAFAEQLWSSTGLRSLLGGSVEDAEHHGLTYEEARSLLGGEVCGLNPRIRIYRYGQYLPHPLLFPQAPLIFTRTRSILWSTLYVL